MECGLVFWGRKLKINIDLLVEITKIQLLNPVISHPKISIVRLNQR